MKDKVVLLFVILAVIVSSALAVAAPSLAAPSASCTFVPNHGWHIVSGGQLNDHWFDTEADCLIAIQVPTLVATMSTIEPTITVEPTLTVEPTESPVVTETVVPTYQPTESPTEPPVVNETPSATNTPVVVTPQPRRGMSCGRAWQKITETVYDRETGFRFFDNPNHAYCKVWLMEKHGINWDVYKVLYPLE
jgi:hypothetical protein